MNAEMPIKAASRHDPAISIFYTQKPVKLFLAFCAGESSYIICLISCSFNAIAHKPSDSYLALTTEDRFVRGQWDIALRDLDYAIGLDTNDNGDITWGELRERQSAV